MFQHIKGPGLHSFVEQANGVVKYVCAPKAQFKSHKHHFMKNTTTALYKHFLQQYPFVGVSYRHIRIFVLCTCYYISKHANCNAQELLLFISIEN